MRDLLLGLGVPLVVLTVAFLPVAMAEDQVQPGYEEHARRLKVQASHSSDLRPGWPRVTSLFPLDGGDDPDAVDGTVRWVGPFGVTVLEVEIAGSSSQADPRLMSAVLAWGALLVAVVAAPAFVVWRHTRT